MGVINMGSVSFEAFEARKKNTLDGIMKRHNELQDFLADHEEKMANHQITSTRNSQTIEDMMAELEQI